MIDAAKFASTYTSFWNTATPTCEHLVRKINLNLYERQDDPLPQEDSQNRSLIAELGFSIFAHTKNPKSKGKTEGEIEAESFTDAATRIARIQGDDPKSYTLSDAEKAESKTLSKRLLAFFYGSGESHIRPVFSGCGLIDRSEGDMIFRSCLFEIKTVERPFRSNDIRQLLTYSALNYLRPLSQIDKLGAYNPRRGIYFELPLDVVSYEVSGKSFPDLFEDIYQCISSGGISR